MTPPEAVRIRVFDPGDLDGVLDLCWAEGWTSYTDDPDRALRVLMAPGTLTVVAAAAERLDLLSTDEATGFYDSLADRRMAGYRFSSEG
jgi:hypothetical protein